MSLKWSLERCVKLDEELRSIMKRNVLTLSDARRVRELRQCLREERRSIEKSGY